MYGSELQQGEKKGGVKQCKTLHFSVPQFVHSVRNLYALSILFPYEWLKITDLSLYHTFLELDSVGSFPMVKLPEKPFPFSCKRNERNPRNVI